VTKSRVQGSPLTPVLSWLWQVTLAWGPCGAEQTGPFSLLGKDLAGSWFMGKSQDPSYSCSQQRAAFPL
jgi:hypothetical protein